MSTRIYKTCPLCRGVGTRDNPINKQYPGRWPVSPYRVVCSCCEGTKIVVDLPPETWRPAEVGIPDEEPPKTFGDVLRDLVQYAR